MQNAPIKFNEMKKEKQKETTTTSDMIWNSDGTMARDESKTSTDLLVLNFLNLLKQFISDDFEIKEAKKNEVRTLSTESPSCFEFACVFISSPPVSPFQLIRDDRIHYNLVRVALCIVSIRFEFALYTGKIAI